MSLKSKIGIAAGALLISGGLFVGAAMASEAPAGTDANSTAQSSPAKQLSDGAKAILGQLNDLRKSYMDKLQTDEKALVDQAVKNGTITQDEADKLMQHGGPGRGHGPGGKAFMGKGFEGGPRGGGFHGFMKGGAKQQSQSATPSN